MCQGRLVSKWSEPGSSYMLDTTALRWSSPWVPQAAFCSLCVLSPTGLDLNSIGVPDCCETSHLSTSKYLMIFPEPHGDSLKLLQVQQPRRSLPFLILWNDVEVSLVAIGNSEKSTLRELEAEFIPGYIMHKTRSNAICTRSSDQV